MGNQLSELVHERAKLLMGHVRAHTGNVVAAGPFQGMKLLPDTSWGGGDISAKLLGHYEAELHPSIEWLVAAGFEEIYNIGCAEGFYAIGMAMRCAAAHVFAFDSDVNAQRVCLSNAVANQVQERLHVRGTCDPALLKAMTDAPARRLMIIDCEGYERTLIDPDLVPGLRQTTLLIECHDFLDRSITATLTTRLAPSHDISIVTEGPRDPNQSPLLKSLGSFDRWLALCEFRPETMHWVIAKPRAV